jgi:hypothetical protein
MCSAFISAGVAAYGRAGHTQNKGVLWPMRRLRNSLAIAGVVALLAPAAAFAQSSSDQSYGGPGNVVAGLQQGSGGGGGGQAATPSPPNTSKAESLPFTGSDLGVLAAAGGLLLALGFGLRRLTHRPLQA